MGDYAVMGMHRDEGSNGWVWLVVDQSVSQIKWKSRDNTATGSLHRCPSPSPNPSQAVDGYLVRLQSAVGMRVEKMSFKFRPV